jgi:hypothetical protein
VNENIWEMSHREKRRLRIDDLPHDLNEAVQRAREERRDHGALGEHIAQHFLAAKRQEWREYISQVSQWELDNYLGKYLARLQFVPVSSLSGKTTPMVASRQHSRSSSSSALQGTATRWGRHPCNRRRIVSTDQL